MLLARSPMATVFWQWINQSVNVMCNYVNRSGASIDASQVAQAYGLAVAVFETRGRHRRASVDSRLRSMI